MSTINCPNCGRPLRPGSKFCGNCGATLPAGANAAKSPTDGGNLAANAPPRPAAAPPGDSVPCPHCGKPVRPTAKFCGHCGKAIETQAAATLGAVPPAAGATPASQAPTLQQPAPTAAQPAPALRPGVSGEQPRPSAGARPAPPPPVPRSGGRRGLTIALLLGLLVMCALAAAGGVFGARQMGWIGGGGTETETATAVITTTVTASPAAITATATLLVSPTVEVASTLPFTPTLSGPAVTDTATPEPTLAALLVPSLSATESTPLTPLATDVPPGSSEATVAAPVGLAAEMVFEDFFDGELRDYWVAWGPPYPAIESGFGDRYLSLRGEDPFASGVTNAEAYRVMNAPGAVIEFAGQLNPRYPGYVIHFDWDQESVDRNGNYRNPGQIHLEIRLKTVTLQTPLTQGVCNAPVQEGQGHTYQIKILENQGVELYIDDSETPACPALNMGLAPLPGKISFSGLGWVSRVKVMQPRQ